MSNSENESEKLEVMVICHVVNSVTCCSIVIGSVDGEVGHASQLEVASRAWIGLVYEKIQHVTPWVLFGTSQIFYNFHKFRFLKRKFFKNIGRAAPVADVQVLADVEEVFIAVEQVNFANEEVSVAAEHESIVDDDTCCD